MWLESACFYFNDSDRLGPLVGCPEVTVLKMLCFRLIWLDIIQKLRTTFHCTRVLYAALPCFFFYSVSSSLNSTPFFYQLPNILAILFLTNLPVPTQKTPYRSYAGLFLSKEKNHVPFVVNFFIDFLSFCCGNHWCFFMQDKKITFCDGWECWKFVSQTNAVLALFFGFFSFQLGNEGFSFHVFIFDLWPWPQALSGAHHHHNKKKHFAMFPLESFVKIWHPVN